MADTRTPGNLNPPGGMCRVPARSPGVLGVFDQGDPNHTSWMGDSPGVLGVNDHADRSLSSLDARSFATSGSLSFGDWLNADRLVIAHELTHVVQSGPVLTIGSSSAPPQASERDTHPVGRSGHPPQATKFSSICWWPMRATFPTSTSTARTR